MAVKPINCNLLNHGFTTQTNTSCCLITGGAKISKPTYLEFVNSDFYKKIKQDMDNGVWNDHCYTCKKVENLGLPSQRINSLKNANTRFTKDNIGLKELTIYLGNECNLQCRSCHPGASSSWVTEINQNKIVYKNILPYSVNFNNEQNLRTYPIEKEDLSNLENVTFLGGEVVYNKKFIDYLKIIYEKTNGNCSISILTNATLKLNFEKYKFLKKFRSLNFITSIDGIEKSAEFIRTGTVWNKVIETVKYYKQFDFLHLDNHTTHSVLNIFEIEKINNWLSEYNILNVNQVTFVEHPEILTYRVLTDEEKQLYKKLTNNKSELKFIYDKMDTEPHSPKLRIEFLEYMDVTKQIHGMNWKDYLPDLYNLMHHFT